jgi:hypothetical protein
MFGLFRASPGLRADRGGRAEVVEDAALAARLARDADAAAVEDQAQ